MTTSGAPSQERHEAHTDAASILGHFEIIGEAFFAEWESNTPSSHRLRHRGDLKEPFELASGATGEFSWLQNPQLYRPGLPELGGKRWLPSGGFKVSETIDGQQILTSYHIGRNLSANTHQPDSAIVIQDRYLEDRNEGQKPLGSTLLTAQHDELQKCADFLSEIEIVLKAKEWTGAQQETPETENPENADEAAPEPVPATPSRLGKLAARIFK